MFRKIIIVDDNAINRLMLSNALSSEYQIKEAADGEQALELIVRDADSLSAVLLDIVMPKMDGYEVLARIRENPLTANIPVIVVTGSEDERSRVKALSYGANDFILKPFNPDIVKHCLKNNIALSETASTLHAIQRDKLTGLYNRETFFIKAEKLIQEQKPGYYMLSCFDVDNFKLINEQYGVSEGDGVLKEIGVIIKEAINGVNGIVGRISADNFAALFPVTAKDNGLLEKAMSGELLSFDQWPLVFSVGRYIVTDTTLTVSALYDRAFLAKQSVKRRFDCHLAYFDDTMLEKIQKDQQILSDMEAAVSERQFEVWLQPQYNHVTGALIGAEALVRWRHPQKGIIPPGAFIPLFEQNGFIYEMDKYVWHETCRLLRKWIDAGYKRLPVSVNISRYDVFRNDLIETIVGYVNEFEIPIELLRLEITESAFAKSTNHIVEIVEQFVKLGFVVEIDDFGSGYSSLNTLKSVPAQIVKLDMRFLDAQEGNSRGGNILESVVRMTRWLGMTVIAEGVETKEQGDFLKSIGCSLVQGYLYAKPMPSEDYEERLKTAKVGESLHTLETAENLDNDLFWSPESLDSLIFNSFIGSACIYEYNDGNLELIRATDKFSKMLGGESMTTDALMKLDLIEYLDKSALEIVIPKLRATLKTGGEVTEELRFINLPGKPGELYIRSTMRVIANVDKRYNVYCLNEDITAQRLSEHNERIAAGQLLSLLDNVNCGITAVELKDDYANFILANNKFYELFGYTKEQYDNEIGSDIFGCIAPEDRERIRQIFENTKLSGKPTSAEYRVVRRDGKVSWIRSFLSMTDFEDVENKVQICTYGDITAERHSERELLDNLPCGAGICIVNGTEAHMRYLNKRYFSYFKHYSGINRAPSVFEVIHPDDVMKLRNAMRPALTTGGEGSCVVRIMDGDGVYLYFRLTGMALESRKDENEIYVTFVPISQEEMSFSEMLPVALEKVMSASSDLSFIKDSNFKYICCSRAFAKIAGLNDEKEIIGKTDFDIFPKSFAEKYTAEDNELIKSRVSIVDSEERLPYQDKKTKYSRFSKYLLYDSSGNIIGLYGHGYDITATREAEEQQKFLINNIPGGVAVFSGVWSNPESIRLTYFSEGFCKLFGYERDEFKKIGDSNPEGLLDEEYRPGFAAKMNELVNDGTPMDYLYKAHNKSGNTLWIHIMAVPGERHADEVSVNALIFDATAHEETAEKLRISEEENRLAISHSKNTVCRFDVSTRSLSISLSANSALKIEPVIYDVPNSQIKEGLISRNTEKVYRGFYEDIINGKENAEAVFQRKIESDWKWIEAYASTIKSADGKPVSAVISFNDVTENFEKDAAYKKWIQSLHNKSQDSYSLYRCNISQKKVFDTVEGNLIKMDFPQGVYSFDERTEKYVDECVYDDDAESFSKFLKVKNLLTKFNNSQYAVSLDYREKTGGDNYRWLRVTVDLVEFSVYNEVEAYLLFENIDEFKRQELTTKEQAQTDPLTGLLNRAAFSSEVNAKIKACEPGTLNALFMMDVDGFKMVNDTFGHGAGDDTLCEIAVMLQKSFRRCDCVGRIGGDEFVVFLSNIPNRNLAAAKAEQICEKARKSFSSDVKISMSLGIVLCPGDGEDFEALYKKADEALYYVKESGRNNFAFYRENMKYSQEKYEAHTKPKATARMPVKKRRMLIVDDSKIDCEILENIFRNDFIIEKVGDGVSALTRLKYYGSAVSVVLLDLIMPELDGFGVLKIMNNDSGLREIPVIVVSGTENRDTNIKAIKAGAADYVIKPVDASELKIRVMSAINKADNEKLTARNSFLELVNSDSVCYKTVIDRLGIAVAEYDCEKGSFTYTPLLSEMIAGEYDGRKLWDVFKEDSVCSDDDTEVLKKAVEINTDNLQNEEFELTMRLKIPGGDFADFSVSVFSCPAESMKHRKLIVTFRRL